MPKEDRTSDRLSARVAGNAQPFPAFLVLARCWVGETHPRCGLSERLPGLGPLGLLQPAGLPLALKNGHIRNQSNTLLERMMSLLQRDDGVVSTWANDGQPGHDTAGHLVRQACTAVV
ncbi:hypothetical protein [Hydrogenophaga sp.]|uniref:hypothetical protein n=1 Tax=Hydrogenophaga sp. TaxID=1904254 RepID=UPI0027217266|nr:hypothetical protein [Hydrogenophaga sp.]MDO8906762.1 hypothetical protein [Hydrogenophaga sp.]